MLLHREFVKIAKKHADRLAIIDRTTDKRITYQKALIAALAFSSKLARHRDGFIGIMIPNSAGSVLAILGTLMAGKVPVMINYSTGAAGNAEYAQRKCGFKTILTSRALLEKIGCRLLPGMIFVEDLVAEIGIADKLKAAVKAKLPVALLLRTIHNGSRDDNAVILFTSGSEKDPKAVQLTHRNLGTNVEAVGRVLTLTPEDIVLSNLPYFHVFGHNICLWLPLLNGMTMVSYANPLEYRTVSGIVREEKVTLMVGTPSFFSGYLRQSEPGDFATLRVAVAGADKVPDTLRAGFREKHGMELCEGYGATETSPVVSVNLPGANKPGSIGRLLPGVAVRIVDINTGAELPPGSEGKILVKGDLVMKGYFDDIEETALRIKDGWYETGDMGVMDTDGYLWHRGRLKRFVKIGGEMVSLVAVEVALSRHLPEGVECCVVEIPDSVKGARIVAAVTHQVDERQIIKSLAAELPQIALPKQFLVMDDLPKMGSGKIDFRGITDQVRERLSIQSS